MKNFFIILFFTYFSISLFAGENRYSFSLSTAQRETTLAEAVIEEETDLFISLEAFFAIDALSGGSWQQGPVVTLFDITNEDDSYADYFYAGWEWIWEFRTNLELIGSVYGVFERSLYKNNEDNNELKLTQKDGYGARLALRVALLDDFGFDIATAKFEVDESGDRTYTYEENSISLVWWF